SVSLKARRLTHNDIRMTQSGYKKNGAVSMHDNTLSLNKQKKVAIHLQILFLAWWFGKSVPLSFRSVM
ncbi:MAG: hypothetical protein ACKO0V_03470, partial [bacterium]